MTSALFNAFVELDEKTALREVAAAVETGKDPLSVVEECRRGLEAVGERYEREEYFLPELLLGANIFKQMMAFLGPLLEAANRDDRKLGKVVIGTVKGDIHDLGKNIVTTMLSAAGFEVVDLGVDVPKERFVSAVESHQPQFVGMSALLTQSFDSMRETIAALEARGLRAGRYIVVGGAPVDETVKAYVGADAVGRNAVEAVDIVQRLTRAG